jgi:predicted sulfurtransferase
MTTPKKNNKKQIKSSRKKEKSVVKHSDLKNVLLKPQLSAEKMDAEELFAKALVRHKKELIQDKKDQIKEMSHLALIAQEYLSSFALIGYSLQDERVVMFNMPSPKDEAALVDLLRATFIDIANNRP